MAALTATQALDRGARPGGPPRLVPIADQLAREYLARNLAALGDQLGSSPAAIAQSAEVVVSNVPGTDPITGSVVTAPTVSIRLAAPVHISLLSVAWASP